jgi:chaperonin cofactor prefoldin
MGSNHSPSQTAYRKRKKQERIDDTAAEIMDIGQAIDDCKSVIDLLDYLRERKKTLKLRLTILTSQQELANAS